MFNENRFENYLYESNNTYSIFEDPSKPSIPHENKLKEIIGNTKKINAFIPQHFIYEMKNLGIIQIEDFKSKCRSALLLFPFCSDFIKIKLNFDTLIFENENNNDSGFNRNFPIINVENLSNFVINNNLSSISKDLLFYPKFNLEKIKEKWDFSKSISIYYLFNELLNQLTSWHLRRLLVCYRLSQTNIKHKLGSLMNNKIQLIYNINEYLISKEIKYHFCFNKRSENDTYFSFFSYVISSNDGIENNKSDNNNKNTDIKKDKISKSDNNKIDIIINMSINDSSIRVKFNIKNNSTEEIIPYEYITKLKEIEEYIYKENIKKEKRKMILKWINDLSKNFIN